MSEAPMLLGDQASQKELSDGSFKAILVSHGLYFSNYLWPWGFTIRSSASTIGWGYEQNNICYNIFIALTSHHCLPILFLFQFDELPYTVHKHKHIFPHQNIGQSAICIQRWMDDLIPYAVLGPGSWQ
jgi:hypothetical protein